MAIEATLLDAQFRAKAEQLPTEVRDRFQASVSWTSASSRTTSTRTKRRRRSGTAWCREAS